MFWATKPDFSYQQFFKIQKSIPIPTGYIGPAMIVLSYVNSGFVDFFNYGLGVKKKTPLIKKGTPLDKFFRFSSIRVSWQNSPLAYKTRLI